MPFKKGQSGNPAGKAPKPKTLYVNEIRAATATMAGALQESTNGLVDKARGLHVLMIRNIAGFWQMPGGDVARKLTEDPAYLASLFEAGAARVYVQEPDLDAIKVLHDRVMGKVPTMIEMQVKKSAEQIQMDHATLARVIQEHVPSEYLDPVIAELERIARRSEARQGEHVGGAD